jgi:hypothetical protein
MTALAQERPRSGLLAVVMLGLLVAALAAAWLVSASLTNARLRAAQLLEELRAHGLAAYLGEHPTEEWYRAAAPDGRRWWVVHLVQPAQGQYGGVTLHGYRPAHQPLMVDAEVWQLTAAADAGKYLGYRPQGDAIEIRLMDGEVTIDNQVTSKAPDNYVPEGLLPLMVRLAARQSHKLVFSSVVNDRAVVGREVRFVPVTLKPESDSRVEMDFGAAQRDYQFDQSGELVKWVEQGITYSRTSRQAVQREEPALVESLRRARNVMSSLLPRPAAIDPQERPGQAL